LKKNIVLIDLDLILIKSIHASENVNIEYLIVEANDNKIDELKSLYGIKNILSRERFDEYTEQHADELDYKTIEKFRVSQLNSEYFQSRFSDDVSLKQYKYFNALSFWVDIFKKKNISAIILEGREHGANYDGLALDVAKADDIPAFIFETHMLRHTEQDVKSVRAVFDYGLKSRISIDHSRYNLGKVDLKKYLFYPEKVIAVLKKKRKTPKDFLKTLFPSFIFIVIRMMQKIIFKKAILMHGFNISPIKIIKNVFYIGLMKKKYDSVSSNLDTSKKYIFYALHFDPEASIMSRTVLSNQLIIIKQLSEALPADWTLYVKEHPIQFEAHNSGRWFYLISVDKYRTLDFYNEILKFDNVCILNNNINSREVIESATAIATINGSIALETMSYDTPLILFGHQSTPFGSCNDVFKITSSKQCREALKIIESGFTPNYSDLSEIVDEQLFELNRVPAGFEHNKVPLNDVKLLVDYMVCEYSDTR